MNIVYSNLHLNRLEINAFDYTSNSVCILFVGCKFSTILIRGSARSNSTTFWLVHCRCLRENDCFNHRILQ